MPRRTVSPPSVADTFLMRICKALDEPPRMLAANIGVDYDELAPLLRPRNELIEMDRDEVWFKISEYADKRLGEIMAVRFELNKALQSDRTKRAARLADMRARTPKRRPPRVSEAD